jgi:hypothetical protein
VIGRFAHGFLPIVLVLYLAQLGSNKRFIRLARGSELIGDAAISLSIKKSADRCRQASIRQAGANISPRTPHSFLAGTRKVRYDILAYQRFRAIKE